MRIVLSSLAIFGLLVGSVPAGAQSPTEQLSAVEASAADALSSRLVSAASGFALTTPKSTMEAQYAVILASFNGSCAAMMAGIAKARALIPSAAAREALDAVRNTVSRCSRGTGAGPNNGGLPGLPGFSSGGSANYEN